MPSEFRADALRYRHLVALVENLMTDYRAERNFEVSDKLREILRVVKEPSLLRAKMFSHNLELPDAK